jgi:hypothetical protein
MASPLFSANDVDFGRLVSPIPYMHPLYVNTNKLLLGLPGVAQKFNFGPTIKIARECSNFLS